MSPCAVRSLDKPSDRRALSQSQAVAGLQYTQVYYRPVRRARTRSRRLVDGDLLEFEFEGAFLEGRGEAAVVLEFRECELKGDDVGEVDG